MRVATGYEQFAPKHRSVQLPRRVVLAPSRSWTLIATSRSTVRCEEATMTTGNFGSASWIVIGVLLVIVVAAAVAFRRRS